MNAVTVLIPPSAKILINEAFRGREPWEIVGMTSTTIVATYWLYNFVFQEESLKQRGLKFLLKLAKCIPSVRELLNKEMKDLNDMFEKDTLSRIGNVPFTYKLPDKGVDSKEILKLVEESVNLGDFDHKNGKVSGCVYRTTEEGLSSLIAKVYGLASFTNPLHHDVFPGISKMESEIVRICCKLFNGDENSCGTMTTGGTESILLACKAYRDYAYEVKGIVKPEIVMPVTAHSAFDKAAQFLKIRVRSIKINSETFTVDIQAMKRAINSNTIMLVGSTPNFPYGTMDDIKSIAQLGLRYDIPVHVDACLGGFLLCFMKEAGFPDQVPPFDFSLKGVCSISADTHKYGYAPKGSSVILYRHRKYLHQQYTITTDWPGGIYGSPTVSGSRAGGIIATCWATMMYIGHQGYVESTQKIIQTARFVEQELGKLDGIYVLGKPATSVIAIGSRRFPIYRLAQALQKRGWNLNVLQFPSALHICLTQIHTEAGIAQQFINDVKLELVEILKAPQVAAEGMYAMYGVSQGIADRSMVGDIVKCFLDSTYYMPPEGTDDH